MCDFYTHTRVYMYMRKGEKGQKEEEGEERGKAQKREKKWKENIYEVNVNISEIWMKGTKDYSSNLF